MDTKLLEKYAQLIVKMGVNLQKDQLLVINSPIECAPFTRLIAETAYQEGAKDVEINWRDELFNKVRFLNAPDKVFDEFPDWQKDFYLSNMRKGAAFVSIAASDPELFKDVEPNRIARQQKTAGIALKEYRESLMIGKNVWTVVSVPTKSWAKKVFPELTEEDAVEMLWESILKTVRIDADDPVAAWTEHKNNLQKRVDILNSYNFKYLRYKNSLGTDFEVELVPGHMWLGGSDKSLSGLEFFANMPTEEIFTMPLKTGANGTVVSSMPLNYNGVLIKNFQLTFKDGKVVDFKASEGYDTLKTLIETDEGSCYLGEVALVPYDSPISNTNILFYNTLFDENASCHLALGEAYPSNLKGYENMSKDEIKKAGANYSIVHEDFMIGTKDLNIVGITQDGKEVPVFIDGNFAF